MSLTEHGGPDAAGVPRWDFSANANGCGPAPCVEAALRDTPLTRYPDPACTALRLQLASFHEVTPARIVIAASASEFIFRISALVAQRWPGASVFLPRPGYADYGRAAHAHGLRPAAADEAQLVWHTEPASPSGSAHPAPCTREGALLVIDEAYAPLRLSGDAPPRPARAWRLVSPNKALGLTGVRAAYAIAPAGSEELVAALDALAPSWPLGQHGVTLLQGWASSAAQQWLAESLSVLREWKREQLALCAELGWDCLASVTPFYLVRWREPTLLPQLRAQGVKLRDTASMGLPAHVRVSVQPPAAQQALRDAWRDLVR